MEYSNLIYTGLILIVIGALFQTFHIFPSFFDKVFDRTASNVTILYVLIVLSFGLLLFILNRGYRQEGFADTATAMPLFQEMVEKYQVVEVCALKSRIQGKLLAIEKGIGTNSLTEDQAREQVEKTFSKDTSNGTVNCEQLQKVIDAKDIDSFFTVVQELPDTVLIQIQETAEKLYSLLQKQVSTVANSLAKKEEGFVDASVGICSPEVVEERRKFLRQKKLDEDAERCLLPEEVPFDSKDKIAAKKVKKIQDTYDAYIRMSPGKPTISELLTKSKEYEEKLNDQKAAVEELAKIET